MYSYGQSKGVYKSQSKIHVMTHSRKQISLYEVLDVFNYMGGNSGVCDFYSSRSVREAYVLGY